MKKKLFINKIITWIIAVFFILAMIVVWYITNNPTNIPEEELEFIQNEEVLK